MSKKVLLASHGSIGARAAEQALFDMSLVDLEVVHLYVVPELWKHMLGDDWLNNQITQERFGNYLETELADEAEVTKSRVESTLLKRDAKYKSLFVFGDPKICLLNVCEEYDFDLVITGSPRPNYISGLNSRMLTNSIKKNLHTTLLQIPHPGTKH